MAPSLPKDGQFTLRDVKSRAHSCQKTHDHQVCHGQKLDSLEAQASTKRGGRGGVAPHQLSHGVDICAILSNDEVPQSPSPVVCPCHYRVTCILTHLEVVSMSTSCVVLACRVDPHCCLVRDQFRSLRLTRGGCPHDVTARYLLKVTMDQWSCVLLKVANP